MNSLAAANHHLLQPRPPFRRRLLYGTYGGQRQGGISTPSEHPFILLFTGDTGEQYGYRDVRVDDGTFRYTGEGQVGDMSFVRGNRAIRNHAIDGKDLYLYEKTSKGHVQFVGQMVCAGYEWVPDVADVNGKSRTIIVFYLRPIEVFGVGQALGSGTETTKDAIEAASDSWSMPMEQLRPTAVHATASNVPPVETRRNVYQLLAYCTA